MRAPNRVTAAQRCIYIFIFAVSTACLDHETDRRSKNSFPLPQEAESVHHDNDGVLINRKNPDLEKSKDEEKARAASEVNKNFIDIEEAGMQGHRVTIKLIPRRQSRLDDIQFKGVADEVFEAIFSDEQTSTWASVLVPVLDVSFSGRENTVSDENGEPTPVAVDIFSKGKLLERINPHNASRIVLPPPSENTLPLKFLAYESLSDEPTLSLSIDARNASSVHRNLENHSLQEISSAPDFRLSFTQESCDRSRQLIDEKISLICIDLQTNYENALEMASVLGLESGDFSEETHNSIKDFCNQEQLANSLWSAIDSSWLRHLLDLPSSDGYRYNGAQGLFNEAKYSLSKALVESHLIKLHNVYRETEVFFSLTSCQTSSN